ncbi:hypothetical protein BegalDRAFT_1128 [Beggiatoa alba B18LD]|uniref:Probable zinc-binding domain-containing protein n=1 Tax=Beggiatoa alba B18LD TaxID=395493 RepID=I3CEI7_9GAMM|nr:zinc-ribbon domain containing protein [Beggiatoa alba]EIJ42030.1 hypothetical protein BegalDRAFT_1128 [Beggiatoa alba B18LD]
MKSNKQRRLEIKAKRLKKSMNQLKVTPTIIIPKGAVLANPLQLVHNHTYSLLPHYYVDYPFTCRDCGAEAVWTAERQRWWYEVVKAHIHSTAVRCASCRHKLREQKRLQQAHMQAMAEKHKASTPSC